MSERNVQNGQISSGVIEMRVGAFLKLITKGHPCELELWTATGAMASCRHPGRATARAPPHHPTLAALSHGGSSITSAQKGQLGSRSSSHLEFRSQTGV